MITTINPLGSMDLLSQIEVTMLKGSANSELYQLFRNCSLATLNAGSQTDDSKAILEKFKTFDINVLSRERGVKLELINPPETAFVDGKIIRSIQANLFAVLRDILFVNSQIAAVSGITNFNSNHSAYITNLVFSILRNANALHVGEEPNLIVCWGGHSINETEYYYARQVGLQLGLRELNICTGCGPGVMEAPMKGAAVGHAQQRYHESRFIGMTEPSIIAAEPPNALVNELLIMPDIEKRLEAFVRMAHGVVIFPGGPGTAEELLYVLGILLNPENHHLVFPLVLTGPKESREYFDALDSFICNTLGEEARKHYQIIIDDPEEVARVMVKGVSAVKASRLATSDAYGFNWLLKIDEALQHPFEPTHENMAALDLHKDQPVDALAAALRRAFSGIVAGNVKESGMKEIEANGPYKLHGDPALMAQLDKLLRSFVEQDRMKLPGSTAYKPCYEIIL
ncbi:nucleotide 5'-monophosphate nucleosidase PpnN [Zophobihabitans entericus]|uniref:Pyrimidine/purine nucleotide 5'-monophosphate nucleosidase n=1 Tax=Zophobihabitans entericus TaxID=1635327 RepID=A0A6G9I855_9GAMM|nr:nucleotide 5'-monophosphate nucleosidase PpnN [Zophobihabitans entericus]QIQ20391.1 LOG family protein [Zophobihabitans entericus]